MSREAISILENPSVEKAPQEALSLEQQEENKALARVRKKVKSFILAGILGTYGYGQMANAVFEYRAKDQYESLQAASLKEEEAEKYFGPFSLSFRGSAIELEKLEKEKKEYWNVFKPVEKISCPACGYKHKSDTIYCPHTGKKIEGYLDGQERREVKVTDIATRDGKINAAAARQYLGTLPRKWVNPSVEQITQSSETEHIHYGGLKDQLALATYSPPGLESDRARITFHANSANDSLVYVAGTIAHEVAHANDWKNKHVSYEDRLDLLTKIGRRLHSEDRYKSAYVESIREADQCKTNYRRAGEYWAEITEQYFKNPAELHFEDFRIVDEHVRKLDPEFNWKKSQKVRNEIVNELLDRPSTAVKITFHGIAPSQ